MLILQDFKLNTAFKKNSIYFFFHFFFILYTYIYLYIYITNKKKMNFKRNGYSITQQYRQNYTRRYVNQSIANKKLIVLRHNSHYARLSTTPDNVQKYLRPSVKLQDNKNMLDTMIHDFILIPDFITQEEHDTIVKLCESKLKKSLGRNAIYEEGHFDGVINKYKECSASHWIPSNSERAKWMDHFIQQRIYAAFFPAKFEWLILTSWI
ncbi:unnamed protein product [Cunninghamella echinulata]